MEDGVFAFGVFLERPNSKSLLLTKKYILHPPFCDRRSRRRMSWGHGSSQDLWLLLLGGLWEDNGVEDEGRPQRPIGRVAVG
jgi:hypothetical protein